MRDPSGAAEPVAEPEGREQEDAKVIVVWLLVEKVKRAQEEEEGRCKILTTLERKSLIKLHIGIKFCDNFISMSIRIHTELTFLLCIQRILLMILAGKEKLRFGT